LPWQRQRADPDLVRDIGGVSVFQGLVDAGLVSWMHQRRLLVLAWTVNDGQRFNELIRLGIDGVTTANLAILQALAMAA
jgi:glycerophosphoryl diester phosphodiesterase